LSRDFPKFFWWGISPPKTLEGYLPNVALRIVKFKGDLLEVFLPILERLPVLINDALGERMAGLHYEMVSNDIAVHGDIKHKIISVVCSTFPDFVRVHLTFLLLNLIIILQRLFLEVNT